MSIDAVIRLDHVYPHPPAAVWKALTDPALHARWWAAGDVKAVVGHRFELDMGNKWGRQPCEVLAVEPERLLRYSFADWTITWRLTPVENGTRLSLTHEGFDLDKPLDRSARAGMGAGWPAVLARLETVL